MEPEYIVPCRTFRHTSDAAHTENYLPYCGATQPNKKPNNNVFNDLRTLLHHCAAIRDSTTLSSIACAHFGKHPGGGPSARQIEGGQGVTVKRATMPPSRCSFTWQWSNQVPTVSGSMSAVIMVMGRRLTMSMRMCM